MYHIKDDPRSQKTAEKLCLAMFHCLQKKQLNEISISDLYRETGIARSTFYRLFDTPEDVLYYMCAQFVEKATISFENRKFANMQELSIASINLSIEHNELLEILIRNHRQDLLTELFAANFRNISTRIPVLERLDPVTHEYVQALLYTTMTSLQTTWFTRGRLESPEQLFSFLQEFGQVLDHTLLPQSLKK